MSENAKIYRDFKNTNLTNLRGNRMTAQQIPIPPRPYSNIEPMGLEQLKQPKSGKRSFPNHAENFTHKPTAPTICHDSQCGIPHLI